MANAGADPTDGTTVTVNDTLPTGLTALINNPGVPAGPIAASGPGWTCTGTRCTRTDVLAAGATYPPITITVGVASNAAATVTNNATVAGGGDAGRRQCERPDPRHRRRVPERLARRPGQPGGRQRLYRARRVRLLPDARRA